MAQTQDVTALGSPDSPGASGECLSSSVPGYPASPKGTALATVASLNPDAH